ncbi:MAG: hypothetical protein WC679_12480 [Bacteroidales bacterium]|jgi:hypothetical protein
MKTQDEIYKEIVKEDNQTFVKGYKHGKEQTLKEVFEEIDRRIEYWEKFLKDKNYQKGSLDFVRIKIITLDFRKLKTKLQEKFK